MKANTKQGRNALYYPFLVFVNAQFCISFFALLWCNSFLFVFPCGLGSHVVGSAFKTAVLLPVLGGNRKILLTYRKSII